MGETEARGSSSYVRRCSSVVNIDAGDSVLGGRTGTYVRIIKRFLQVQDGVRKFLDLQLSALVVGGFRGGWQRMTIFVYLRSAPRQP